VLLAVGAPFGFLILANTAPLMTVATICGVSGALLGALVGWSWRSMRRPREAPALATGPSAVRIPAARPGPMSGGSIRS
jgi:hypothetical protein